MTSNTSDSSQLSSNPDAFEGAGVEVPTSESGTEKSGGLGSDGTIPPHPNGIAAGHSDTASNFNPEEDEDADV
ncbi:hypothetical protein FHS07_003243 [Microbacterium proteolyticum]|uniref:Uncharacterized protein n=1 Tax=Microbacterium proteolyticum TaxID=1572644 RepID=A0A7W5CKU4_9MICO|nr:hypothetical protein [Microbacterium proteolyticum]MBB3159508.1 hypothetical protein [Microbacterium proteolyticum]